MGNKLFFEKHGFLLFPTILSIFIIGMLGLALSTIYGNMFSTLSAGKSASQSQQFAEIEAEYLKLQGYDEADNLVHTWKTMEDFVGDDDGKNWESRLENIRTVNTASGDKVKIFKISTRKFGDVTSRYSLEVPLSSQSGYVPVGSVITWPSGNLPEWMTHGDYLECNGQAFDTKKYPRLYKALGDNHVPDYRGVFLRGYGSRTYSSTLDFFHAGISTTVSSGELNVIQSDAGRNLTGGTSVLREGGNRYDSFSAVYNNRDNCMYWADNNAVDYSEIFNHGWSHRFFPEGLYKYSLVGDKESGYHLIEQKYFPTESAYDRFSWGGVHVHNIDASRQWPTAQEFRPVNIAVKYFIKAR